MNSCFIQDHTQGMTIGKGRHEGNLYIFYLPSSISVACNNVSLSQSELSHYRLGHPSYVKLHTMSNELNIYSQFKHSSHCSIGPLAKHKCLPFLFLTNYLLHLLI